MPEVSFATGTVSSSTATVYVLVHPLSTNGYWVQNIPTVSANGEWRTQIRLGTRSEGAGQSYEILALATNENWLMRLLRQGNLSPLQELDAVPRYLSKPGLVTVDRID